MKKGAALIFGYVILGLAALLLLGLQVLKYSDRQEANNTWRSLADLAESSPALFSPEMVDDLPDPVRRYFLFSIMPGTPLRTVAEIKMSGKIGLGSKESPNYMPMQAQQIISPPHGLVWKVNAGSGLMEMTGSDGYINDKSWVRFWILHTIPVVHVGGTPDYNRSSFGRVVAEAAFWSPASLLPQQGISWQAVTENKAKVTVEHNGIRQQLEITVADNGAPVSVVIPRWSNANPEKEWRVQPFGGTLSEFKKFDGFNLATRVDGGNFFGTDDYFPFYRAKVEDIRFK